MIYAENIYLCLILPLLIAALCAGREHRRVVIFVISGMTMCLLSGYISSYLELVLEADPAIAAVEISPFVEETMKLLPILFYLVVFRPSIRDAALCILMNAAGFATFENVCFLTSTGASNILGVFIRGAGSGAMHVVCGIIVGVGLLSLWGYVSLKAAGALAVLCVAITYHGVFNLLIGGKGVLTIIGFAMPLVTVLVTYLLRDWLLQGVIQKPSS